jgi:PAS domain S-box-containing protein
LATLDPLLIAHLLLPNPGFKHDSRRSSGDGVYVLAGAHMNSQLRIFGALVLSVIVFSVDTFTELHGAIAVTYILAIIIVAPISDRAALMGGSVAIALTLVSFGIQHVPHFDWSSSTRFMVSVVAISLTTLLTLRDRMARTSLVEQARILELSHDTIIIRDRNDTIIYWNDGAEHLYGWTRAEAIGKACQDLLKCCFPAEEVTAALNSCGQWTGEVTRVRRDGTLLILASRWLRRTDAKGRAMGIVESSADLTKQLSYDAERRASEQRYKTIFQAAGFATWEADWSRTKLVLDKYSGSPAQFEDWLFVNPQIMRAALLSAVDRNANAAAVELFQASSEGAITGSSLYTRCHPESLPAIAQILAKLCDGEAGAESEVRLKTLRGEDVDVVLRVNILPNSHDWSHVLVMAFDVTKRNMSSARIEQTSSELAHAARVSLLGQLSASIAHEVNQPLTAILNYARSGESWISRDDPDLGEVSSCLARIVTNGNRAASVIKRVKSLATKAVTPVESFNLSDVVDDALGLVRHEAKTLGVRLKQSSEPAMPFAYADRVQIQQVLVNLIMNGLQAMQGIGDRRKELRIHLGTTPTGMLQVEVRDTGTGFTSENLAKVFEPFFTTKQDGMGMGLSICRSIVETHGGHIRVMNNEGSGATVAFSLPPRLVAA